MLLISNRPRNSRSSDFEITRAISNSNWTEWSTIQGIIARVISKSDEREARGRFEIMRTITPFIVHLTKLLNFDWSRAIQLISNCTP